MDGIAGLGNWKIRYQNTGHGVRILRAVTCDREALLPDEIEGVPVTEIGAYAFTPPDRKVARSAEQDAESEILETEIFGGFRGEKPEWTNRNIETLTLPATLRKVGKYAFDGCRRMTRLRFTDVPIDWNWGAFSGAAALHDLEIYRPGEDAGNVEWLISAIPDELLVTVRAAGAGSGDDPAGEAPVEEVRVLFPGYHEYYEENVEARQFAYHIEGGGYPYHRVFRGHRMVWREYDALWRTYQGKTNDRETAALLAWCRLRWPKELNEAPRQTYLEYVRQNPHPVLERILRSGTADELTAFLRAAEPGREVLEAGAAQAREAGRTDCTAVLMEETHRRFPQGRRKRFEL